VVQVVRGLWLDHQEVPQNMVVAEGVVVVQLRLIFPVDVLYMEAVAEEMVRLPPQHQC
jgi:hypothetical protein